MKATVGIDQSGSLSSNPRVNPSLLLRTSLVEAQFDDPLSGGALFTTYLCDGLSWRVSVQSCICGKLNCLLLFLSLCP